MDAGGGPSSRTVEHARSPPRPPHDVQHARSGGPALLSRLPADVLARLVALVGGEYAVCWRLSCRALRDAADVPTRTPRLAMLRSRALAAWAWALPGFRSATFHAWEQARLCALAAGAGSVGALAWLRERGCGWHKTTCSSAARGGHLEVLQLSLIHI